MQPQTYRKTSPQPCPSLWRARTRQRRINVAPPWNRNSFLPEFRIAADAHIIVVAMGENFSLKTGFGSSEQASMQPCAYNNPIFVDADGNGFAANGDELGWSLPTGKEEVEAVKARLTRAGLNPLTARR